MQQRRRDWWISIDDRIATPGEWNFIRQDLVDVLARLDAESTNAAPVALPV